GATAPAVPRRPWPPTRPGTPGPATAPPEAPAPPCRPDDHLRLAERAVAAPGDAGPGPARGASQPCLPGGLGQGPASPGVAGLPAADGGDVHAGEDRGQAERAATATGLDQRLHHVLPLGHHLCLFTASKTS